MKELFEKFKKSNKLTRNEVKMLNNLVYSELDKVSSKETISRGKPNLVLKVLSFVPSLTVFTLIIIVIFGIILTPSFLLEGDFSINSSIRDVTYVGEISNEKLDKIIYEKGKPAIVLASTVETLEEMRGSGEVAHMKFTQTYSSNFQLYDKQIVEEWYDIEHGNSKRILQNLKNGEIVSSTTYIDDGETLRIITNFSGQEMVSEFPSSDFDLKYDPIEFEKNFYKRIIKNGTFSKVENTTFEGKKAYKINITFGSENIKNQNLDPNVPEVTHTIFIDKNSYLPIYEEYEGMDLPSKKYEVLEYIDSISSE